MMQNGQRRFMRAPLLEDKKSTMPGVGMDYWMVMTGEGRELTADFTNGKIIRCAN